MSLILSRDYGNATLAGLPAYAISRLQSALNAAARLVFSLRKYDPVTLLLQELHWLKVEQRIEYKLAVLVYRCLHGLAPPYLANDFRRVADLGTRRRLRSASCNTRSRRSSIAAVHCRRPCLSLGRGASVEQSARRHGVNVAAHVQATPEDCSVREKLLNTGCFRRLEHLPSHVFLFAYNFVRCPCSRSHIMPP